MTRKPGWMAKGAATAAVAMALVVGSGVAGASAHTGRERIPTQPTQYQCQQQLGVQASYWRGSGHQLIFDEPCHLTSTGWTASFQYYHPGGPL